MLSEYDRNNRLKKIIRPTSAETVYEYDDNGNLTSKTDREEKSTSYEYDELNRLKKVMEQYTGNSTFKLST